MNMSSGLVMICGRSYRTEKSGWNRNLIALNALRDEGALLPATRFPS